MLPMIIMSLMILILSRENNVLNKKLVSDTKEINYPFFNSENVDDYIKEYLDEYIIEDNEVLIDYDCIEEDDLYYLTFYKYIFNGNMISSDIDFLLINIESDMVSKLKYVSYEYDVVQNKIIDNDKKLVALTFDDGPNYNTNKILDILEEFNVSATFFVLGSKIKGNEYILERMVNSGNEIGNHTFNHLLLTRYKEDKIEEEIESTSNLIFETIGKYPMLLRTGYGSVNNKIKKISNYPIVIWNIDTLDWKYHNSKRIASRVINKVKDGDIVLMHDVYSATANALYTIIPDLQAKGYDFVTVSELFYYKGITLENGKVYASAKE